MINSETGSSLSLAANIPSVYSAAHLFSGVPVVPGVMLSGISKKLRCACGECVIRVLGTSSGNIFLKREIVIKRLRMSDYITGTSQNAALELSDYRILPEAEFFAQLSAPLRADITLTVSFAGQSAKFSTGIRLLPFGHICPEMPPELCASYVLPGCVIAGKAADVLSSKRDSLPEDSVFHRARLAASVVKSLSLTYSPLLPELPNGDCVIRDFDTVASSNNRGMSLTEAVLLYCSAAERIGLSPVAVFIKKDTGAIKAFVGIRISGTSNAVCESISELKSRVLAKELFLFDILGLLGTEDTDFSRNVSEATLLVLRSGAVRVTAIDIDAARSIGVRSIRPFGGNKVTPAGKTYAGVDSVIAAIDEGGKSRSLYGFSPYNAGALGILAKASSLEFGREYPLFAIDEEVLCTEPDSFGYISSYKPRSCAEHPRNMTEQAEYDAKIRRLLGRIETERARGGLFLYSASSLLSGRKLTCRDIRDNFSSDIAALCEAVRGKRLSTENAEIYAAAGSVSFVRDGVTYYAPCAFVPCKVEYGEENIRLKYGTDRAILNIDLADMTEHILGRIQTDSTVSVSGCRQRQHELLNILSHFAGLQNYDTEFTYHPDIFLAVFDLSCTLMRGCIESTDGKLFERFLMSGSYTPSGKGARTLGSFEATLPFMAPSVFTDAVKCADTDSAVIAGPHGSGKKAAAANIAVRSFLAGQDTLICSRYPESLESMMNTFRGAGLAELCIALEDTDNFRRRILSDISLLGKAPKAPALPKGEPGELEEILDRYNAELTKKHRFGYSLYECINEYCLCQELADGEVLEINAPIHELDKDGIDSLIEISERLCESTRSISGALHDGSIRELYLDKFGTARLSPDIKRMLEEAKEQTAVFAEKSTAARICLGIPLTALSDVRSLRAFGDFLESVIFSGVDFMPEGLLGKNAYSNAKAAIEVCDIIDKLRPLEEKTEYIPESINSISCRSLYAKWREGGSNPFTHASVMHELKKHLPTPSRLTPDMAGELLEALSEREELRKALEGLSRPCAQILGALWNGIDTDTETARRAARFAILSESCRGRMLRNAENPHCDLRRGITALIAGLKSEDSARADLLLSLGAFRRLIGNGGTGLFDSISAALSVDLYELRFEDGILSENGIARLFSRLCENTGALEILPEYNSLKRKAVAMGLAAPARYAEEHGGSSECVPLFRKSIFAALAQHIIDAGSALSGVTPETFRQYISLYSAEKQRCAYSIKTAHRDAFMQYISDPDGKADLEALVRDLKSSSYTAFEVFDRNTGILRVMYSIILSQNTDAYRLSYYPSALILLDSGKTDAAEAIPLCAHFDRCVFVSSLTRRENSILGLLPKGIPVFESSTVLCEKNGCTADLAAAMHGGLSFARPAVFGGMHFVKCEGGMYDRDTGANRIEALTACETALDAAKRCGFENVGILAATPAQASGMMQILDVLARKHGNAEISSIPVRYIGNVGDFSKDVIVFSAAFGKNVYSVTRSFGIFDTPKGGGSSFSPAAEELLCAGKELYVVSSAEPYEILTDSLQGGAAVISAILAFARYGVTPKKLCEASGAESCGIEKTLAEVLWEDGDFPCISAMDGVIFSDKRALIYSGTEKTRCYDRVVLPFNEYSARGYDVSFIIPTALLSGKNAEKDMTEK